MPDTVEEPLESDDSLYASPPSLDVLVEPEPLEELESTELPEEPEPPEEPDPSEEPEPPEEFEPSHEREPSQESEVFRDRPFFLPLCIRVSALSPLLADVPLALPLPFAPSAEPADVLSALSLASPTAPEDVPLALPLALVASAASAEKPFALSLASAIGTA